MEVLQPLGLAALLTVPAIVALYVLRQRRAPRRVASLMLWKRARTRVHRGRPWERFRPSLLMVLQLLAAAALALALARPACVVSGLVSERLVVVLDASASMGAEDVAPSRWAAALARAEEAIDAAPDGAEVALIRAGRTTRVVEPFTQDRGQLRARLRALEAQGPDATRGALRDALLLGLQLQRGRGEASGDGALVLISDGAFEHSQLPPLQGALDFVRVGESGANLAITTLELRRAPDQRFGTSAVCVVANTGDVDLRAHLEVRLDGRLLEAHQVALAAGQTQTWSVPVDADQGRLVARLEPIEGAAGARDHLRADDEAFAVLTPERPLQVLVVGANPLVERALAANPRIALETRSPEQFSGPIEHDVVVFEGYFPKTIPSGRFLAIDPPEGNPLVDVTDEAVTGARVASWDRGHPALYHVDLAALRFGDVRKVVAQNALVPLAEFEGAGGPLVLAGRTPSWRALVWTTSLLETDLPLKVAFPVLLYNALGWLSPGGEQNTGRTVATGQPLAVQAREGDRVAVALPGGARVERALERRDTDGVFWVAETARPGFYEVEVTPAVGGAAREEVFAASMVDRVESQIAPRARLELPRGGVVTGDTRAHRVEEWARWLAALMLALVALEWWLELRQRAQGEGR